jgi:hypothetical protein
MRHIHSDERGLSTVEYIMLLGLIAIVGFGAFERLRKTSIKHVRGMKSEVAVEVAVAEPQTGGGGSWPSLPGGGGVVGEPSGIFTPGFAGNLGSSSGIRPAGAGGARVGERQTNPAEEYGRVKDQNDTAKMLGKLPGKVGDVPAEVEQIDLAGDNKETFDQWVSDHLDELEEGDKLWGVYEDGRLVDVVVSDRPPTVISSDRGGGSVELIETYTPGGGLPVPDWVRCPALTGGKCFD